ncbi:MAG TPA: hypothetical protein VF752_09665 [Thermoleophilaceae bacterium]
MQTEAFKVWRNQPDETAPVEDPWLGQLFDAIDSHIGSMAEHLERVLVEELRSAAAVAVADLDDRPVVNERHRSLAHFAFGESEHAERFLKRAGQEDIDLLEAWYALSTARPPGFMARARRLLKSG